MQELLFQLLRLALEKGESFVLPEYSVDRFRSMGVEQWNALYDMVDKQTLLGVAFLGVERLREIAPDVQPSLDVLFQWSSEAETVRGLNRKMNDEAKRLTELFESRGFATAILKGQANARLYPDPLCRQPGDIDIWVDGGKQKVRALLEELNMMDGASELAAHHFHLPRNQAGIAVEAHFRMSSGNLSPITTRAILKYLEGEMPNRFMTPEGFYSPTVKFALVMQLSHIQRHLMGSGVGLRQIVDYLILLRNSTSQDRAEVACLLKRLGLLPMAKALMWLLREKLGLERELQLCDADSWRGNWLLKNVLYGGNFGFHTGEPRKRWLYWWLGKRRKNLRNLRFNPTETFWAEVNYWNTFVRNTPARIKYRKISLRDIT